MRFLYFFLLLLCTHFSGFAQSEQLAKNYFDRGEFGKAENIYEKLLEQEPFNASFFYGLIATYQQLEKYGEAEKLLKHRVNNTANAPHFLVELGHNYELQGKNTQADQFYTEALRAIESRPNYAFSIARSFEKYSKLDRAVTAYELGMKMNPDAEYSIQLARLYGEQGDIEKMFSNYIDVLGNNPNLLPGVSRIYSQFISDDPANEANLIFRKLLLKKLQEDQNILYNNMLSWLFVQQKEYQKAFQQEKAIYRRSNQGLGSILRLTVMAQEEGQLETALEVLDFIIAEAPNEDLRLQAHQLRLNILQETLPKEKYSEIEEAYKALFETYGKATAMLSLYIDYANFLAFKQNKIAKAREVLNAFLERDLQKNEEAALKMALADILVLDEKFNQALIYFSQVQNLVENDVVAQMARFKVAKTSYYKGDFDWATIQLDVLKSATSQLIANDAMELSLLISENSLEDSTRTALKLYARADLLAFQEKNAKAIEVLDSVLTKHKGEKIEDDALLKQAKLYEEAGKYEKAEQNYLAIIEHYKNEVLGDNAHYYLAELYAGKLDHPDKAKEFYEKIIFNYADSIYFVDARKKFRQLRGDELE
ncbi:tetratricopeptide repeat protein [Salinimicrobium sp. TH3]|uniref:tetratricopeptide repeat protein n=1 Tax=Salinimicrobium sp. TH3 TaxID=2997342 RepID=UPI002274DC82|nr:tetratricopeptide repeat protein [Salinimicrobium sp. TH3]MCY2685597.1 tetratricopeptide repeat protein [Salinimicrobium sp. TH3]